MEESNLLAYCRSNKGLQIEDAFKYCYQSCFGCEHLACDARVALERIGSEAALAAADLLPTVEPLDGDFCRVHLRALGEGLSPETLCRVFLLSAEKPDGAFARLDRMTQELLRLCAAGFLPFGSAKAEKAVTAWRAAGFPACRHSEAFRAAYRPAYRVVKKKYADLLPLLIRVDALMKNGASARAAVEEVCPAAAQAAVEAVCPAAAQVPIEAVCPAAGNAPAACAEREAAAACLREIYGIR